MCRRQKGQEWLQVCGLSRWVVIFMKMRKLQEFGDLQASAYKLLEILRSLEDYQQAWPS